MRLALRFFAGTGGRLLNGWLVPALLAFSILAFSMGLAAPASGQAQSIEGTVTDAETGEPLPGVNVQVVDATVGTSTDANGAYELSTVPADADSLTFSFIGYRTARVAIDGRSTIDIVLQPEAIGAEGIVVTALGVTREEDQLGYAVESVDAAQLDDLNAVNVGTTLAGRVAGLEVDQAGSGPGGSSRLILRGSSSLNKDNQALIVLDGIPINNTQFQPAGRFGGFDFGDGITNLDPNNIESASVLKGPSAAALYGTRGGNGVIEITTKKGQAQEEGVGVSYRTSLTFEEPTVWIDEEFQNTYGRGTGGTLPADSDGQLFIPSGTETSFGPRMEGQSVRRFNGEIGPYSPQENNVRDFYETGTTLTNSVGFSGGNDNGTFRASYTNLRNRGLLPGHELDQNTFSLAATYDLSDRLTATGRATYLKRESFNRPVLADNPDNTVQSFLLMPRSVRLDDLRDFRTPDGDPIVWNNSVPGRKQNPFWTVNLNTNDDERDRVLGMLRAEYRITDWLSAQVRGGQDYYAETRQWRRATGTVFEVSTAPSRAKFEDTSLRVQETNYDALLTAAGELSSDFTAELNAGASRFMQNILLEGVTSDGASVPNLFTRTNAQTTSPFVSETRREIQSAYGFGQLAFREYAFLDVTARNDWSSTLPEDNRSFFYPSVSGSLILTDAFDSLDRSALSFAKLRASWAEAGNDASPYQIQQTFSIGGALGGSFGGQNYATVADELPNLDIKPEITTSVELGTDLRFFNDRSRLSVTFYDQSTDNQIINIPVSAGSGFPSRVINAGEVTNTGVEISVGGTPVETDNLQWDLSFNFGTNTSKVKSFPGDIDTRLLGTSRAGVQLLAEEGKEFGQLVGETFARNDNGDIIVDDNGIPQRGGRDVIGSVQPDWTGGLNSTVAYRGLALDVLIDTKQGGDIYSLSNATAHFTGNHKATLEGREDGFVFDGVTEDGSPNETAVDPETFWTDVAAFPDGGIDEAFVYDASYIRLKQVTLSYQVPESLLQNAPLQSLRLSATGSNLLFFERHTDGFDPTAYSRGSSSFLQGLEYAAFPNTRSLGFSVRAQF